MNHSRSSSIRDDEWGEDALDKNESSLPSTPKDFLSEIEVCEFIGISLKTLRGRISRGRDHPPATEVRRGKYVFNRELFNSWVKSKKTKWEV